MDLRDFNFSKKSQYIMGRWAEYVDTGEPAEELERRFKEEYSYVYGLVTRYGGDMDIDFTSPLKNIRNIRIPPRQKNLQGCYPRYGVFQHKIDLNRDLVEEAFNECYRAYEKVDDPWAVEWPCFHEGFWEATRKTVDLLKPEAVFDSVFIQYSSYICRLATDSIYNIMDDMAVRFVLDLFESGELENAPDNV